MSRRPPPAKTADSILRQSQPLQALLGAARRLDHLQTLLDAGYIVAQEVQTSTRPATVYLEVEQDEDP